MQVNVGHLDRLIRIVVGLALLGFAVLEHGAIRWVGLIGIVPLFTAIVGMCPLYSLLRIRTTSPTAGKS